MPAVDTIEALTAAAQAFGAQRLGLQVEPDAEAAVRESLQRTGLVLLGEIHGVAQTPVLVEEMIAWFGLGGIALEWHHDFGPWLDRWVAHGELSDPRWGSALARVFGAATEGLPRGTWRRCAGGPTPAC